MSDKLMTGSSPVSPLCILIHDDLKLTAMEAAELCAFTPEVLNFAINALPDIKKTDHPYTTFYHICIDYCSNNNIQPDFKWAKKVREYINRQVDKEQG